MIISPRTGLVAHALKAGGSIHPLLIPPQQTNGTGLMNPSVYLDGDKLLVNIRHVNYTLYHSEGNVFHHHYGPLQYLHPEHDRHLRTINYIAELNTNLTIKSITKVNTEKFDVEPIWEFVGLEDGRLFRWDNKLYLCGVRRDTTTNGQGRMELSELDENYNEISRWRIPAPPPNNTYCEKNWMPVLDMPYHFVKWSNPTEVVKVDPVNKTCETVVLDETNVRVLTADMRGGSQILPWGDYRLGLIHEVVLYNSELGRKNGRYRHRFVLWDKEWDIAKISPVFSFMTGEIEFACGAAIVNDDLLVSFGFQDNAAYILKISKKFIDDFIWERDDATASS